MIISWKARLAILAEAVAPNLTLDLLALAGRFLPRPPMEGTNPPFIAGMQLKEETRSRGGPARWLAWLSDRAERIYNEVRH